MPSAEQLRAELRKAVARRRRAEAQLEEATADVTQLLEQVADTPGISMTEAAELLGVSRVMAYKMLRRRAATKKAPRRKTRG